MRGLRAGSFFVSLTLISLVVVVLFLMMAPSAYADERADRAAALFKQAQVAFEKKAFAAAAAAFEEAAQLSPHAATWLNAGEARERDGDLPHAVADYDHALESESAATEVHLREAKSRILRLEPKIATVDLAATSATMVKLDGRFDVSAPRTVRVAPGHHTLVVGSHTMEIDVAAGEKRRVELLGGAPPQGEPTPPKPAPVVETPPAPSPPKEGSKGGPPTLSWVAFGTGGAAAVVGGIFGALTLSAKSTFTETPTIENRDDFYEKRTITNVALVVTGVAVLAGVAMWVLGGSK
jgi:hypothetical protein